MRLQFSGTGFAVAVLACSVAMAHVAYASGKYDGIYEGEGKTVFGSCSQPGKVRYRVTDNHISRQFGGQGNQIELDVAPDGAITTATGAVRTTGSGSITGDTLSLEIRTAICLFKYNLVKNS